MVGVRAPASNDALALSVVVGLVMMIEAAQGRDLVTSPLDRLSKDNSKHSQFLTRKHAEYRRLDAQLTNSVPSQLTIAASHTTPSFSVPERVPPLTVQRRRTEGRGRVFLSSIDRINHRSHRGGTSHWTSHFNEIDKRTWGLEERVKVRHSRSKYNHKRSLTLYGTGEDSKGKSGLFSEGDDGKPVSKTPLTVVKVHSHWEVIASSGGHSPRKLDSIAATRRVGEVELGSDVADTSRLISTEITNTELSVNNSRVAGGLGTAVSGDPVAPGYSVLTPVTAPSRRRARPRSRPRPHPFPPAPPPPAPTIFRPRPLLDHFHGLHFGIMEPAAFPQRPPVRPSYSVEGTFLWAVGLFGTVENGAVLLTVLCSKKFKRPLHLLIGSLAVTDLFVSLVYIPSYTYYLLEGDRILQPPSLSGAEPSGGEGDASSMASYSLSFCRLSRSIFVEMASVTLTIKALIAIYLYISACSREWVAQVFSARKTFIYLAMAWAMNFAMMFLPTFLGFPEVDFYPNSFICSAPAALAYPAGQASADVEFHRSFSHGTSSAIYTFLTLAVHIAELAVICLCFMKVHLAIIRGKVYSDQHRSADKQAKINYLRALKITALVFASFCVCWMPIYVINILDPTHTSLPEDVHHLVMDLLLLKSSINPTIYIYGVRSLRYEIKLLCLCRCRKDNNKDFLAARQIQTSSEEGPSGTFSTVSAGV